MPEATCTRWESCPSLCLRAGSRPNLSLQIGCTVTRARTPGIKVSKYCSARCRKHVWNRELPPTATWGGPPLNTLIVSSNGGGLSSWTQSLTRVVNADEGSRSGGDDRDVFGCPLRVVIASSRARRALVYTY